MLPDMQIPDVHTYNVILEHARDKAADIKPRAVLLSSNETDTRKAFDKAVDDGLIEPIVVDTEAADAIAHMVDAGEIDMIVAGSSLFNIKDMALHGKTMSHVAVLKPQKYQKLLLLTDGVVNAQPDIKTKIGLIGNLVSVSEKIGITSPRIAVVAAVEAIYPQMPVTLDGAVLAKMTERGQIKGAYVDGPLSFDVAVDMFAAHSKGIKDSQVAGQADAMLASNMEVANGIYNAMTLYGNCDIGGVIVGGKTPIAVNSRADSESTRYNSIALTVLAQ